jgi:hypothetical protein
MARPIGLGGEEFQASYEERRAVARDAAIEAARYGINKDDMKRLASETLFTLGFTFSDYELGLIVSETIAKYDIKPSEYQELYEERKVEALEAAKKAASTTLDKEEARKLAFDAAKTFGIILTNDELNAIVGDVEKTRVTEEIVSKGGVVSTEISSLPVFGDTINGIIAWFTNLSESVTNYFGEIFSGLAPLGEFFKDPIKVISEGIGDIFKKEAEAGLNNAIEKIAGSVGHSPEYKTEIEGSINNFSKELLEKTLADLNPDKFHHSIITPADAATNLNVAGGVALGVSTGAYVAGIVAESATFGQIETVMNAANWIIDSLGVRSLTRSMIMLPLESSILKPASYHYNSLYTPEIPATTDLINMVVKEKIGLDVFKLNMKYQGISEDWSQKIWDAHFIAPSLSNLLTSWRRNHITTEQLDKLEILVDLDPLYKNIWEDQRYVDPSITIARFMFETGVIDKDGVKDILRRNGLFPADIEGMANFITTFQERLWRRRYIMQVANGYNKGVFSADRLKTEILAANYTEGVADWMIKTEDVKKEIVNAKVPEVKEVLITLTILKDAYLYDDVDEAYIISYFQEKGYDPFEISLAVKYYNRLKAQIEEEKKKQ